MDNSNDFSVDEKAVSQLYEHASRPAEEGKRYNRVTLTFTITPKTDTEWRDFLQTHTGTLPKRGKGISSAMVELSMQLTMGVIADFQINRIAGNLEKVGISTYMKESMVINLRKIADEIERQL